MTVHRVRDAVAEDATYWGDPRVLVKLLHHAHRLPVHAHPSRAFAREHLGSAFGSLGRRRDAWRDDAEAWLGLRGDAFVIPAAAHKLDARGDLRVLRCLGPENGGTS